VKTEKNIQQQQGETQEDKPGNRPPEKPARTEHSISPGAPPSTDDLQRSRSAPSEAEGRGRDPHAQGPKRKPSACADHAPTRRARRGPAK